VQPQKKKQQLKNKPKSNSVKGVQHRGSPKMKEAGFEVNYLFGFVVSAMAFLVYANTIGHGYALDDVAAVTDNKYVQEGFAGIPKLLAIDFWHFAGLKLGYYRPLALISFAIEYQFFGLNPQISHLINVLLFCTLIYFSFILLSRLFNKFNPLWAFLVCLLFVAHPIHTEVVANIKGRDELLSFLNLILALHFILLFLHENRRKYFILSLMFFYLALLSKESALTGIILVPLVIHYYNRGDLKKILKTTSAYLIIVMIFFIQKKLLFETEDALIPRDLLNYPYSNPGVRFSSAFMIFLFEIRMLIFPHPLRYEYSYNQIPAVHWNDFFAVAGLLIFVVILIIGTIQVLKRSELGFAIAFFYITLIPAFGFTLLRGGIFVERSLFAPSFGFCIAIIIFLGFITKTDFNKLLTINSMGIKPYRVIFIISLLVFFIASAKCISRNSAWKDSGTLYQTDIITGKNSAQNHLHLGNYWLSNAYKEHDKVEKLADIDRGIHCLRQATLIVPDSPEILFKLGYAYELKLGITRENMILDSAIYCFNRSIELDSRSYKSYKNLGIIYEWLGRYDAASYFFNKSLEINPQYEEAGIKARKLKETRGLDVKSNPLNDTR